MDGILLNFQHPYLCEIIISEIYIQKHFISSKSSEKKCVSNICVFIYISPLRYTNIFLNRHALLHLTMLVPYTVSPLLKFGKYSIP